MKNTIGYTLSPDSSVLEFNEKVFIEDLASLEWSYINAYEYHQEFDRNDIIWYSSVVLYQVNDTRIQDVLSLYQIYPSQIRSHKTTWEKHYIFYTTHKMSKARMLTFAKNISTMYDCHYQLYTFYSPQCIIVEDTKKKIQDSSINLLLDNQQIADSINVETEEYMNLSVKCSEIVKKLHQQDLVDDLLNIVPGYWPPFSYVTKVLWSIDTAYKFFNEHYKAVFKVSYNDLSEYLQMGIPLKGWSVFEKNGWYWIEKGGKEWGLVSVTDFTIKVHYQLQRNDELVYIVTLVSSKGKEIKHVEWKNTVSENSMADYVLRYWPFHLSGNKVHIRIIHEMISNTKVPTISTYSQYGLNVYKGWEIMILPNAVYDFDTKRFFPKHESLDFYFMGGNDGITVEINKNTEIDPKHLPLFSKNDDIKYVDLLKYTSQMYVWDMQHIPLMVACGMAWAALFKSWVKKPHYYITGTTGSWKSTMSSLIANMFWVENAIDIYNTTLFPLRAYCSWVNRLPLFFQEYRRSMPDAIKKDGIIRLVFDEWMMHRWTQNGTILNYPASAQMLLEWEDSSGSGSVRTRCILITMSRPFQNKKLVSASRFILEAKSKMNGFFSAYCQIAEKNVYESYLLEWMEYFAGKSKSGRILENMSMIYTWCMTFAPEMKDTFISVLDEILKQQNLDFENNGEHATFLKVIEWYLAHRRFADVYVQDWYVYLPEPQIRQFMDKQHSRSDLSFESGVQHMEELWFEYWWYDMTTKWEWEKDESFCMFWFKIAAENTPRRLLSHPDIYEAYKIATKKV